MTNSTDFNSSAWKYLWLIALCGLPALGWVGVLDDFSSQQVNHSISSAGLIYATARGINALVSLLQGTELDLMLLTFSIGEVLDPINDLIERFSELILIALGSLALQKILLAVVSHTMFNVLLTLLAVAGVSSLLAGRQHLFAILLRSFFVVAFFRFSLGLVVLANSWVDQHFLDKADQQRHLAMERFQGELREADVISQRQSQVLASSGVVQEEISQLDAQRDRLQTLIARTLAQMQSSEARIAELIAATGGRCALTAGTFGCGPDVKTERNNLELLGDDRKALEARLEALADAREEKAEVLACLAKQQQGEACSIWDKIPDVPNPALLRSKLKALDAGLSDFAENTINLLVSLLLKTVAIPLLFFYILLKIIRVNWDRLR
jgi:signal transduction histidine kinase